MEDIVLIGFGGHAKVLVDTIEQQKKYHIIGFIERDSREEKFYKGYKVVGNDDDLLRLFQNGVKNAFIAIGYLGESQIRKQLYARLKEIGYNIPVIIDKTAVIAEDVTIGEGTYIGKSTVINANAKVGNMCIINTGAILEHDCSLGDFSHIAVGAVACGMVQVGKETLIGANATLIQGINLGNNVKIGAGSVILKNVEDNMTACGIWKGSNRREG